jgi:predicted acetyltransferase
MDEARYTRPVDVEIRPVGIDLVEDVMQMLSSAFGEPLLPDDLELERPIFETSRNLVAFDGETMVGSTAAAPFEITLSGGPIVPCAGITSIGVLPTHRRRGIMRALLRRQVDELHDQGTPLAYLWASEAAIYQRFGYGVGALAGAFEIRRQGTTFLHPVQPEGRYRLIERDEALKSFTTVYDRVRPARPGMLARDDVWTKIALRPHEHGRGGGGRQFYVLYETPGGPDGYVTYRIREGWSHNDGPDHTMEIEEMMAATDDAYAALWRYCFEVDLVRHVRGWKRPADEPLLFMLAEPRALGWQVRDGTWLRLVQVGPALEARRYGREERLVLEVRDAFCDWNQGSWELEGGRDGASCRRTDTEPDLALDVGTLACAYLGAVPIRTLARAGRVEERTAGAVGRADAMFASDVAPWCPHIF